jgi:hypothetical protein
MDNASYHSVILNKSQQTQESEIVYWLKKNNIIVGPTETKEELFECLQPFKLSHKIHELDQTANQQGHQVIWLPPYHCQYNPTELIWTRVKREVADKNNTF